MYGRELQVGWENGFRTQKHAQMVDEGYVWAAGCAALRSTCEVFHHAGRFSPPLKMSSGYETLPTGCIRLLEVHPRQGSDLISCTLRVEALRPDNPPFYEALSYVWGSPSPTFPILLDGQVHQVQINLLNFL